MVVPYGDPSPLHGWKNAFDAGEWGLGRMTQSLTLGCDCLGEIHYFDATLASETGEPYTIENAICLHEEDYGILWKHVDLFSGPSEVRRSRRLVVNSVATVGNYEYALLLVPLPRRQHPARGEAHRDRVADGDRAGHAAGVRERRRARRRGAAPPAPVQRPARLRRRRDRQRGLRGRGRDDAVRATTTRGATRSVRTRRGSAPRRGARRNVEPGDEPVLEGREPARAERARPAGRVQARPDDEHADAARAARLERRQARRVRAAQPLGHAVRARRAPRRG